jgi:acyl dehydratase
LRTRDHYLRPNVALTAVINELGAFAMTEQLPSSGWIGTVRGQPKVGDEAQRRRKTNQTDISRFTEPAESLLQRHEATASGPFGGMIVQGGVVSALLNAVVAEDLPGPGTVFLETRWKSVKAIRAGEEILARARVTAVRSDQPICTLETVVMDEAGEVCQLGTATTYTVPLKTLRPFASSLCPKASQTKNSKSGCSSKRSGFTVIQRRGRLD